MEPSYKMLLRYGEPSKMDTADFGTLCKVTKMDGPSEFYVQLSQNAEDPKWAKLDTVKEEEAISKIIDLLKNK